MVRLLHTADIHLEKFLSTATYSSKFSDDRRNELWETTERMLDYASANNVDLVLISGDLYESEYFGLNHAFRLMELFNRYSELEIVLLAGNHDRNMKESVVSKMDIPINVNILNSDSLDYVYFPTLNTSVYGIGWESDEYLNYVLNPVNLDDENINILMLHADLINKNHKYMYLDKDEIEKIGFDYVALGHIHSHIELGPRIAYPGTPEPLDFGELNEKGFLIIDVNKQHIAKKFVPFAKRTFEVVNIYFDKDTSEEDVISSLKELDNKNNFYRIFLEGDINSKLEYKLDYLIDSSTRDLYYKEIINNLRIDLSNYEFIDNPFIEAFIDYINNSNLDESSKISAINKGLKLIMGEIYVDY